MSKKENQPDTNTVSIRNMDRRTWKEFRDLCYELNRESSDVFTIILREFLKNAKNNSRK